MTAKEIAEKFSLSKSAISKHLDVLKEAKLVASERTGMSVIYLLNASVFQTKLKTFLDFFNVDEAVAEKGGNEHEDI